MNPLDREKLLSASGVFAVIAAFKLEGRREMSGALSATDAVDEVAAVLARFPNITFDIYVTAGLEACADYFVRVHAYDLAEAQNLLLAYGETSIGRVSQGAETLVGITKERDYITAEKSPALNQDLAATAYRGGEPRFAIVVPVKKTAEWWCLREEARRQEIETHTAKTLPYLAAVKRKLYHSTGLDDVDFITYFETDDLKAFHELARALVSIPENMFHVRWGNPILLGTIQKIDQALNLLWGRSTS